MSDIIRADPTYIRRAVLIVIAFGALGAVLILTFEHFRADFLSWITSDPGQRSRRLGFITLLLGAAMPVPLLGFAFYVWNLGTKVVREQQFPPSGMTVIRDTVIMRGSSAVWRGRAGQILAVSFGILSIVFPLLLWRIFTLLK